MAFDGKNWALPAQAGAEDHSGHQFQAVALDDGKVANNGFEAVGILYNKPASGEAMDLRYKGVCKFRAGGAITKGAVITVATSGYLTAAGSGYHLVGRALAAVTSGSLGTGLFDFTVPNYANTSDFVGG